MLFSDAELVAKLSRDVSVERDYSYDYNAAFCAIYPLLRPAAARIEQLKDELAAAKRWALECNNARWAAEARLAEATVPKQRIGALLSSPQGTSCHG